MKLFKKIQDYYLRQIIRKSNSKFKRLDNIPDIDDKIEALFQYIYYNQDDDGGSWEYHHSKNIARFIDTLSQEEANRLCKAYLSWDEKFFFELADPFLLSTNPYINGVYEYSRIFLAVKERDNKEYIIENLIIITGEHPQFNLDHKQQLLKKVIEASKELNRTFPRLETLLKEDIAN